MACNWTFWVILRYDISTSAYSSEKLCAGPNADCISAIKRQDETRRADGILMFALLGTWRYTYAAKVTLCTCN